MSITTANGRIRSAMIDTMDEHELRAVVLDIEERIEDGERVDDEDLSSVVADVLGIRNEDKDAGLDL